MPRLTGNVIRQFIRSNDLLNNVDTLKPQDTSAFIAHQTSSLVVCVREFGYHRARYHGPYPALRIHINVFGISPPTKKFQLNYLDVFQDRLHRKCANQCQHSCSRQSSPTQDHPCEPFLGRRKDWTGPGHEPARPPRLMLFLRASN